MSAARRRPFVFTATGTHGIVLPLIAIAAELVRRGYDCDLLANEPFRAVAKDQRIGFTSIAPAQFNDIVSSYVRCSTYVFPSFPRVQRYFAEREATGERPRAVVNADVLSASNAMCELYRIPRVRAWLYPAKVRSVLAPSWPLARHCSGHFPHTATRHLLPKLHAEALAHPHTLLELNRHRTRWGLPAALTTDDTPEVAVHMALFPDWYAPPAPDWPRGMELLGFPLPAPRGGLDPVLVDFIRERGRPLVFTPGTGVASSEEIFQAAAACCAELDLPGIFLSLHRSQCAAGEAPRLLQVPYAELGALLPHALLLVHNGGIGSVARALEAGVPQMIRPVSYDQPDNGRRIASLGVGAVLEPAQFSGGKLAQHVSRLLGDVNVAQKLESLGRKVRESNAVSAAADMLEREFGHDCS